jgi:hypothetical protein
MEQVIKDNANAIFALLGTLAGAALTFFGTWILQSQEARSRLLEKVLDKRIQAHEKVIELSKILRQMTSLSYPEKDGELARTPAIMMSHESFAEFLLRFTQTGVDSSTWLSTEVIRELNFIQDYFINLYEFLRDVKPDKFPEIGRIIRQDFLDFSSSLEKLAFSFFAKDLTKMKLNDLNEWHKYPVKITQKRLKETAFLKKADEILKIINE